MSDSVDWTKDQSGQITALYEHLKGKYEREAYQKLFGGPQLPYQEAHSTLVDLVNKQEAEKHSGLEAKADSSTIHPKNAAIGKGDYAVGLLGAFGAVALFSTGAYALGLLGALAAGYVLLKKTPIAEHARQKAA